MAELRTLGERLMGPVTFPLWWVVAALTAAAALMLLAFLFGRRQRRSRSNDDCEPQAIPATRALEPTEGLDIGKLHEQGARAVQQDSFGVSDPSVMAAHGLLAVVADGMGGLSDGDKVSATAVETALDAFIQAQDIWPPQRVLVELATQAVQAVNELLGPDGLRKSGSTLLMGLVRKGQFTFLSIGDTRVCLYRDGHLIQLNREHVYWNELALRAVNGELTVQEAFADPRGKDLVSFLGMGALARLDLPAAPLPLLAGDKLLLMSDGVYNALSDEEITSAMAGTAQQAAEAMGSAIQEKNYTNQDNYTAVVLACTAGDTVLQEQEDNDP